MEENASAKWKERNDEETRLPEGIVRRRRAEHIYLGPN